MSRRRSAIDVLTVHLALVGVLSAAVGLLAAFLVPWPVEVALWLSGFTAGLIAAPLLRSWLAVLVVRLTPPAHVPAGTAARTAGAPRTGRSRTRRTGR